MKYHDYHKWFWWKLPIVCAFVILVLLVEETRGSEGPTVAIYTSVCNARRCLGTSHGCGTIVEQRNSVVSILTNLHVVTERVPYGYELKIFVAIGGKWRKGVVTARGIVNRTQHQDLAIIQVGYSPTVKVAVISGASPANSSKVYLSSFMNGQYVRQVTDYAHSLSAESGYGRTTVGTTDSAYLRQPIRGGQSGGGVYNTEDELVGVIWGQDSAPGPRSRLAMIVHTGPPGYSGWGFCVEYDVMRAFLNLHKVGLVSRPLKVKPTPPKPKSPRDPIKTNLPAKKTIKANKATKRDKARSSMVPEKKTSGMLLPYPKLPDKNGKTAGETRKEPAKKSVFPRWLVAVGLIGASAMGVGLPVWAGYAIKGVIVARKARTIIHDIRQPESSVNAPRTLPMRETSGETVEASGPTGGPPATSPPMPDKPGTYVVDSPPLPQSHRVDTRFVNIESDRFRRAFEEAKTHTARRYPGAQEILEVVSSLADQFFEGDSAKSTTQGV